MNDGVDGLLGEEMESTSTSDDNDERVVAGTDESTSPARDLNATAPLVEQPHTPHFGSLLFEGSKDHHEPITSKEPEYFSDLHLDQIVESIVGGREEQDFLRSLSYTPLHDVDTVHYRHEIFRDLQDRALFERMKAFTESLRQVRLHLTQLEKMSYRYQREGWFLDGVAIYCDAVRSLADDMNLTHIRSRGLLDFRDFLSAYITSAEFKTLALDTNDRKNDLAQISYCVRIRGGRVDVRRYEGEADYSAEVEKTFERFKQGAVKDYRLGFRGWPGMNHVGAQILDLVARLFPDVFSALDDFCRRHADFFDDSVRRFDRELQFYLAYLDYIEPLRTGGVDFCYPEVSTESHEILADKTFDLALAHKLVADKSTIICNEFHLDGPERVFVVSGPNQGGKTTFARTFGQLHHLASIGYLVPGRAARLFLPDKLFTHFEREEDLTNLSGKLENDLVRIQGVLREATSNSIIIMNEIFTSTTLHDARFLGKKVLERIIQVGLLCVYVTFVDELASLDGSIVSMMSTVVPENPAERTYKVVRAPADGLAYALAIAEKYNLTYERLKGRILS
jgi:DNA mismatch repair protein MutS